MNPAVRAGAEPTAATAEVPFARRLAMSAMAAVLTVAASGARSDMDLQLRPAEDAAEAAGWTPAVLTVTNRGAPGVRAVRLRPAAGGPTRLVDLAAPPESRGTARVLLPAVTQQQTYRADLLDENGQPVAARSVGVEWEVEHIRPGAFLAPDLYQEWAYDLPEWPASLRKALFAGAALAAVLLTAAGLLPRRLRPVAVVLLTAGATALAWGALVNRPVLETRRVESGDRPLVVVTSRRTAKWTHASPALLPLYLNPRQMRRDDLLAGPDGVEVTVEPTTVRLFRPAE